MTDQPNYTRIPNDIIEAMPTLGNAELRVLLAIARKTIGWQKECDVISTRQIEAMTGLGHRHVLAALDSILAKGLIDRTPAKRRGFCYRLVPLGDQFPKVTSSPRVPDLVTLGDQSSLDPVPLGYQQKKDSKEKKEKSVSARSRTPRTRQTSLDSLHEAVAIYKQLTNKSPPPTTATLIATTVVDSVAWHAAVKGWCDRGYKAGNVEGMIDWYLHPEKQQQRSMNGSNNGKHVRSGTGQHSERGPISKADEDKW